MHLTGFRSDIYSLMDAADLIVFPTHMNTCGRIGFEAGALGKPVVVTMRSRDTRVVLHGTTGHIIPERNPEELGRAIAWHAEHPEESFRMGEAGRGYIPSRFNEIAHAQSVMSLYDEVLAEAAASARQVARG
jgi:glycosyltransferase involved in cell wall biosynthesis